MAQRLASRHLVAWTQFCAAELYLAWGNTGEARALVGAARVTYESGGGSALTVGWCHEHLGWVAVADGDLEQARVEFERAADLAGSRDEGAWLAAHALAALAPLTALLRDAEHGLRLAEEAIVAARGLAIRNGLIMALSRAAETALIAGAHHRAAGLLAELLALLQDQASPRWVADSLEMAGLVLEAQGDPESAAAVLHAADTLRAASGENQGGTRVLAQEVQRGRDRLLGDQRRPALAADAGIARALDGLARAGLVSSPAPTPR
jgi:tetratricopeptide (TPR) repeat protein